MGQGSVGRLGGGHPEQREGLSHLTGRAGGTHQTKRLSQRKALRRMEVRRDAGRVPHLGGLGGEGASALNSAHTPVSQLFPMPVPWGEWDEAGRGSHLAGFPSVPPPGTF